MAITTFQDGVNGLLPSLPLSKVTAGNGVQSRPFSLWGLAGVPAAGAYDATLAGVALSAPVTGQIPFNNPDAVFAYLGRLAANCNQNGTLILADRLWHNGGFTITQNTAQTVNSAGFPARDCNGTTNGDCVLLGVEMSVAGGAAAPTITVSYTNQAGVAGRTATNYIATANSPPVGHFFPLGLQAGDRGVRSVQSLTLSTSWLAGTMHLVAYRELMRFELTETLRPRAFDLLNACRPRLYNSSVPFLIYVPSVATTVIISGSLSWAHG